MSKKLNELIFFLNLNSLTGIRSTLDPYMIKSFEKLFYKKSYLYTPPSFLNKYIKDPNDPTKDGLTPLMYAIQIGANNKIINYLIECGADINAKYHGVYNILIPAIKNSKNYGLALEIKNERAVEMSIDDKKLLNEELHKMDFFAFEYTKKIGELVDLGADINSVDKDGKTLFQKLIEDTYTTHSTARSIRNIKSFNLSDQDKNVLNEKLHKIHPSVFEYTKKIGELLDLGADINSVDENGKTLFQKLIQDRLYSEAESIRDIKSFNLSDQDKNVLNEKLHEIDLFVFRLENIDKLVDLGADLNSVDKDGKTLFQKLIEYKAYSEAQSIRNIKSFNLSDQDKNFLNEALHEMHPSVLEYIKKIGELLNLGLDINSTDKNGNTLLISSILNENNYLFDFLLEQKGIDINKQNTKNQYPLDIAFESINKYAIEKLLNQKALISNVNSIEENICFSEIKDHAKKRYPYFKALEAEIKLSYLNNKNAFELIKDGKFKSLYFRVKKLELNEELSNFINQAQDYGVKEILIFCDKDESSLNKEQFENFIRNEKVRINFNILPVTENDIKEIRKDNFAKENILAIKEITDYNFIYRNGHIIYSLRSKESDDIINQNNAEYKNNFRTNNLINKYTPQYRLEEDPNSPLLDQGDISLEITHTQEQDQALSLNLNLDLNVDKNQQIAIDEAQMRRKLDLPSAKNIAVKMHHQSFSDQDILSATQSLDGIYTPSTAPSLIEKIFRSNRKIKYITEDALAMIIDNRNLFEAGINIDNIPIGLAFTDGIIFKSDKRPEWMPIDEFTIKLYHLSPILESPTQYSWLQFASLESLTPNKLYGTNSAPFIRGHNYYPTTELIPNKDISLAYPRYAKIFSYSIDHVNQNPIFHGKIPEDLILEKEWIETFEHLDVLKFRNILSTQDITYLNNIYNELEKRGFRMSDTLRAIQLAGLSDSLLTEKAILFFNKLFNEIMPINDDKKNRFIRNFLEIFYNNLSDIEDLFQGLDASYKSINEFLIKQEIPSEHHETIIEKFIDIIKNTDCRALTTRMDTVMRSLRATALNGGNLYEQLEYLYSNSILSLSSPSFVQTIQNHNLNVLYNSDLNIQNPEELLKPDIYDIYTSNRITSYLSKIPPHQRPAIDYIDRYLKLKENREFKKGRSINGHKIIRDAVEKHGYDIEDTKYLEDTSVKEEINAQIQSFYNIHREDRYYSFIRGLDSSDVNLITDYTENQIQTNNILLNLNILSSTGNNYDSAYPDGEFSQYLSVFDIMFEGMNLKLTEDVMIKYIIETKSVIRNYDLDIYELQDYTDSKDKDESIEKKERAHATAVNKFIEIYKRKPTLDFHQIACLGLVDNLVDKGEKTLKNAKSLYQYNQYFSQALRAILGTEIDGEDNKFAKLRGKANNIARTINFLTQEDPNRGSIHQIITNKGQNPENIALFACFFGKEEFTLEKVDLFLKEVNNLPYELKVKLLDRYKFNPLPFKGGEILDSSFPQLQLSDISNFDKLRQLLDYSKVDYKEATRFNDISLDSKEQGILDLRKLADIYGDKINIPNISYKELKNKIIRNENYILLEIAKNNPDKSFLQSLSKDIFNEMLMIKSDVDNKGLVELEASLLFNDKLSLHKQILDMERSHKFLQKIFKNKEMNRREFLNLLHREPAIAKEKIGELLKFLSNIDITQLAAKNYTLNLLIKESGNEILGNNFEAFKLATELFLEKENTINFSEMSKILNTLVANRYSTNNIKQIFSYCLKHNNYKPFELFSLVSGKTNNIDKIVDQITEVSPQDLELIHNKIPFDKLVKLSPILKMQNMINTIIKYKETITDQNYKLLYDNVRSKRKDIYSENIFSYLLSPRITATENSEEAKPILNNLSDIEKIKLYFSKQNSERFEYKEERLRKVIDELKDLNKIGNQELTQEQKDLFYTSLEKIYMKANKFSSLTDSELKKEAQTLKHNREILSDNVKQDLLENDLTFIALMSEVSYRKASIFPRDTQLLSILMIALTEGHLNQQISTGQGKTWITAWNAAYLAYTGQTTFVATSNSQLAERDLKAVKNMFDGLSLHYNNKVINVASDPKEFERGKILYSTHSDTALYISQIEFNQVKGYKELFARMSLVSDEVDNALTSPVHYKLAIPLANVKTDQAKILFKFILDYTESDIFKDHINISIESHIHNLKENIKHKFSTADLDHSYKYPLSELDKDTISRQISADTISRQTSADLLELSHLNDVLNEIATQTGGLDYAFKKLLLAYNSAKKLKENKDYIIPQEEPGKLINALPIIGSRASKETRFGNGGQGFLHLLIEHNHPELRGKMDYYLPNSIVFDQTAENLHHKIHLAGGRHIGLSGTLGDRENLNEFFNNSGFQAVAIPDFQNPKRVITQIEASNQSHQQQLLLANIDKSGDRPILIFVETIEDVKRIYDLLKDKKKTIQTADANMDNEVLDVIGKKAGDNGTITVSTRIMGRGNDFKTNHPEGFIEFNLCTAVTNNELYQTFGRVARDGARGHVLHIPNKEQYLNFPDHDSFMTYLAKLDAKSRNQNRLELAVKLYFSHVNAGNQIEAIKTNEFISESWKNLLKNKSSNNKTIEQLENEFKDIIYKEYPREKKLLLEFFRNINDHNKKPRPKFEGQITEDTETKNDIIKITAENFPTNWKDIEMFSKKISIKDVEMPKEGDPVLYKVFYDVFYESQMNVLYTHTFELSNSTSIIKSDYVVEPMLLGEKNLDREYSMMSGEGSGGDLMSKELKESFAAYKKYHTNEHESIKLKKVSSIINKLDNLDNIDSTKFKYGQYQPLSISVAVDSNAGHALSILTDGKFIVVANRGYRENNPGLKIYKINQDKEFNSFLKKFQGTLVTYTQFNEAIDSIAEKNPSSNTPNFIQVDMKGQKIGNCGWAQLESLLMSVGLVGSLDSDKALPEQDSNELQEAIRYADVLYQDFTKFDRLRRIENIIYTLDPKFESKYLSKTNKKEIDYMRKHLVDPINSELLERVTAVFEEEIGIYEDGIYENDAKELLQKIKVEDFLRSEAGMLFTEDAGKSDAKIAISGLLVEEINQLKSLYSDNLKLITEDKDQQKMIIKSIINQIITDYNIDGEKLIKDLKDTLDPKKILNREIDPLKHALFNAVENNDFGSVKILVDAIGSNNLSANDIDTIKALAIMNSNNAEISSLTNSFISDDKNTVNQNIDGKCIAPENNVFEQFTNLNDIISERITPNKYLSENNMKFIDGAEGESQSKNSISVKSPGYLTNAQLLATLIEGMKNKAGGKGK